MEIACNPCHAARILRGLRIAARLGLSFSKDTDTAIRRLSSSVARLDKSRIMMELNYMLSYGAAGPSICLLRRYNLLQMLLPFHAAYLDLQGTKITAENPMMLMRLFFNLDKLVSCDRPADYTLWVGLLSFHQALVSNRQNAFVVWVFASVLYHGKWKEGVKFAREHAKEQVKFLPEISGFSEIGSDEELVGKVSELALAVQHCLNDLTKPSCGYVFVSKKIERNVHQIFDVLLSGIESYKSGKESLIIDYDLLGKGNLVETRFVLGKIILKTISGGLVAGEEVDEDEMSEVLDRDSEKNEYVVKKNRKRGQEPSSAELKLKTAKKHRMIEKCSHIDQEVTINEEVVSEESRQLSEQKTKVKTAKKRKQIEKSSCFRQELSINKEDVVPKKGSQQLVEEILKAIGFCQLPEQEIEVKQELSINKEVVVPKEGSQQLDVEDQRAADACQSPEEEIKVNEEEILEKKDCHSSSFEGTNKKRDKQKKAAKKKSSREIKENEENILEKKDRHSLSFEGTNKKRDKQKKAAKKKSSREIKVDEENILGKKDRNSLSFEGTYKKRDKQMKAAKKKSSREIKVDEEKILEKKDCHSSSFEGTNKKRDKQKKVAEKKSSRLLLSSLFKEK